MMTKEQAVQSVYENEHMRVRRALRAALESLGVTTTLTMLDCVDEIAEEAAEVAAQAEDERYC